MRISPHQTELILSVVAEQTGPGAHVMLFGSRTDDKRRGGDIDLLIESDPPLSCLQRIDIQARLEGALSLPIDIVVPGNKPSAFQQLARATAVPLGVTA